MANTKVKLFSHKFIDRMEPVGTDDVKQAGPIKDLRLIVEPVGPTSFTDRDLRLWRAFINFKSVVRTGVNERVEILIDGCAAQEVFGATGDQLPDAVVRTLNRA